jgi:ribosome-binding factor A
MDEKTREVSQEALEHSAGYLRSELGRSIKMFTTPQLHFVYDESVSRGMHMTSLINQVAKEDAEKFGQVDAAAPAADEEGSAE